jgi:hypothetical protein
VIRVVARRAFVAMTAALLAVVALATVTPGQWSGATPGDAKTRARVVFDVTPGSGFIQPYVRIDLPRCRSSRTLHVRTILRPIAAERGRFSVRTRFSPAARAMKVRLRFQGRFTSADSARGTLRGRLRYAGGHRCRIPRLRFVAHPAGLTPVDDELGDVIVDDDEEFEEDDDFEDDEEFDEDEDFDDDFEDDDEGDDDEF